MNETLRRSELFAGLEEADLALLLPAARRRSLDPGEYLFLLGENADRFYVVLEGRVDVCFPISFRGAMRDISVESNLPGDTLGWSALVKPYRFTLSARSATHGEVAAFLRQELLSILEGDGRLGQIVQRRVAELIGRRFLTVQALWARELQRSITGGLPRFSSETPGLSRSRPGETH